MTGGAGVWEEQVCNFRDPFLPSNSLLSQVGLKGGREEKETAGLVRPSQHWIKGSFSPCQRISGSLSIRTLKCQPENQAARV